VAEGTQRLTSARPLDIDRVKKKTFWFKQPKKKNGLEVPQNLKDEFLRMRILCGAF
jgi:hypothetical protein